MAGIFPFNFRGPFSPPLNNANEEKEKAKHDELLKKIQALTTQHGTDTADLGDDLISAKQLLREHAVRVVELEHQVGLLQRECKVLRHTDASNTDEQKIEAMEELLLQKERELYDRDNECAQLKKDLEEESKKRTTIQRDHREEVHRLKSSRNILESTLASSPKNEAEITQRLTQKIVRLENSSRKLEEEKSDLQRQLDEHHYLQNYLDSLLEKIQETDSESEGESTAQQDKLGRVIGWFEKMERRHIEMRDRLLMVQMEGKEGETEHSLEVEQLKSKIRKYKAKYMRVRAKEEEFGKREERIQFLESVVDKDVAILLEQLREEHKQLQEQHNNAIENHTKFQDETRLANVIQAEKELENISQQRTLMEENETLHQQKSQLMEEIQQSRISMENLSHSSSVEAGKWKTQCSELKDKMNRVNRNIHQSVYELSPIINSSRNGSPLVIHEEHDETMDIHEEMLLIVDALKHSNTSIVALNEKNEEAERRVDHLEKERSVMIQDLESFSVALQGEKDKRKEQKKERREEMEDLLKQLDASREMIERHFAVISRMGADEIEGVEEMMKKRGEEMEEERRLHDIARETDEEEKEQMRQRIACLQSEQQERAKLVAEMKEMKIVLSEYERLNELLRSEMTDQQETSNTNISAKEREISQMKEKTREMQEAHDTLIHQLEEEKKRETKVIEDLTLQLENVESQLVTLREATQQKEVEESERSKEREEEISRLQGEKEKLLSDVEHLKSTQKDIEAELMRANEAHSAELEKLLHSSDLQNSEREERYQNKEKLVQQLSSELENLREQLSAVEKQLHETAATSQDLASARSQISDLQARLDIVTREREKNTVERSLESEKERQDMEERIGEYERQLSEMEKDLEYQNDFYVNVIAEKDKLQKDFQGLTMKQIEISQHLTSSQTMLSEYKEINKNLTQQLSQMRHQLDEVKNEKEKERLNNNQLSDQLTQLTSEKEELSRANDAWNDHQDVLQQRIREFEEREKANGLRSIDRDSEEKRLRERIQQMETETENVRARYVILEEYKTKLEEERKVIGMNQSEAERQYRALSLDAGSKREANEQLIANNAALEETIKALQLRNDLLVQHSDAVARELNEKSLLIDTQNMELDNVHKMVLQRNLDLEMMTRYSDENQRKIEEYIVDANSYVEETHNLRLEIKKLSQSIHQIEERYVESRNAMCIIEKERIELRDQLKQVEDKYERACTERNLLRANYSDQLREETEKLQEEKKKSQELLQQLNEKERESRELEEATHEMESRLQNLEHESFEKQKKLIALKKEDQMKMDQLAHEKDELTLRLEDAQKERNEYRMQHEVKMQEMEAQVARWNTTLITAHSQKEARYDAEVRRLQSELALASEELHKIDTKPVTPTESLSTYYSIPNTPNQIRSEMGRPVDLSTVLRGRQAHKWVPANAQFERAEPSSTLDLTAYRSASFQPTVQATTPMQHRATLDPSQRTMSTQSINFQNRSNTTLGNVRAGSSWARATLDTTHQPTLINTTRSSFNLLPSSRSPEAERRRRRRRSMWPSVMV